MRKIGIRLVVLVFLLATTGTSAAADLPANVLIGQVRLPSGEPLRNAWVGLEPLETNPSTSWHPLKWVAQSSTDGNGRFSLAIPTTSSLLSLAAENDGVLNMMLFVRGVADSDSDPEPEPAAPGRQANLIDNALGSPQSYESQVYSTAMAVGAAVVDNGARQAGFALQAPNSVSLRATMLQGVSERPPRDVPGCYPNVRVIGETYPFGVVGEFHTYDDVTGYFKYGKTADTEMGVAYSYAGGNWEAEGTTHMGNYIGAYAQWNRGPHWGKQVLTQFRFVQEEIKWGCDPYNPDRRIRAVEWWGATAEGADRSFHDGYYGAFDEGKSPYKQGFAHNTEFHTEHAQAYRYSQGFSAFGVSIGSQSGYSTTVQLHWNFGSAPWTHYLIGRNGPPKSANVVYSW